MAGSDLNSGEWEQWFEIGGLLVGSDLDDMLSSVDLLCEEELALFSLGQVSLLMLKQSEMWTS